MLMFLMLWPNAITYQADQGKDMQITTIDFLLARGEKRARGGAREEERERKITTVSLFSLLPSRLPSL